MMELCIATTSTPLIDRELMPHEVGFDYGQAAREINHYHGWSYARIARFCGYESRQSISNLMNPTVVPSHTQGEKLYILYVELFGHKPPPRRVKPTGQTAGT